MHETFLLGIVDADITVLYTLRGISEVGTMTPDAVLERFGVPPERYVELAALRGDGSDNLPGVPGVGAKTGADLITRFGSVEGIYAHLDEVPGKKVPVMLREHRDAVTRNLALMTLRRDVAVGVGIDDLVRREPDRDGFERLFAELELRTLGERVRRELLVGTDAAPGTTDGVASSDDGADGSAPSAAPAVLLDGPGLEEWLAAAGSGLVAVAVTAHGRPPHVAVRHLGLAHGGAAPVAVAGGTLASAAALRDWLSDGDRPKVVQDLKLLLHALPAASRDVQGVLLDVTLAGYLLAPDQRHHDLEALVPAHLGRPAARAVATEGRLDLDVEGDEAWRGAAAMAVDVLELAAPLRRTLEERGQLPLHDDIEVPVARVLSAMEDAGIAVDVAVLDGLRGELAARVADLEAEVHRHAGHPFNVASGPQLQTVLFEELGLPLTRRTKTGHSTDATALADLAAAHPIVGAVLEWREVSKLLSTYVDALPPLVDPTTGRIHTSLSQTTAATGRLSSSNPNLQNIPVRRPEGRAVRRAFVAGEGYATLLVADYSQIELRILAHLSEDEGLLSAFAAGEDIHATTAARLFDVAPDAVDGTLRDRAKAVNYGLAYGLTAFGLARQLGLPPDEAQAIVAAYDARFPAVRAYLDGVVAAAARDGYTTTLYGRRRYLPDLTSGDRTRRGIAERMALNAPIQGTAADIIKLAMVALQRALDRADVGSRQILQVHDEVVLEVVAGEEDAVHDLTVAALSGVAELRVPLVVDTAFGRTWFDAQKH